MGYTILALLETADSIEDMDLPGLNLHELKGQRKGTYAVKVSGNWRVTFQFEGPDAVSKPETLSFNKRDFVFLQTNIACHKPKTFYFSLG